MSVRTQLRSLGSVFVNYVADPVRDSPVNLAMARLVIAFYVVWKTAWIDWGIFMEVPFVAFDEYAFLFPTTYPQLLVVEKYLLLVSVLLFAVGYRIRLTGFLSGLIFGHVGLLRFSMNGSGGTTAIFISVYFLFFFALFASQDELSADGVRRTGQRSLDALITQLKSTTSTTFRADALKYSLLALGIIYFGSAFDKLFPDLQKFQPEWVMPYNLSRIVTTFHATRDQLFPFSQEVVNYPVLVFVMATTVLALEAGLIVAMLAKRSITPFILGLAGFKFSSIVLLGIFFGDAIVFFLLFFTWDTAYRRLVSSRRVDVVFDERCYFCARSLYPFKLLDVNDTMTFYSQSDLPEQYRNRKGIDYTTAMYLFDEDGNAYRGYWAFRELLRQLRVFAPLAWAMGTRPVAAVGERIYEYVAANRSRHFVCSVDFDAETEL
ncbi:Predicted thiol-disulfide oxidoreductase YuxK, DCC family [Halogranum rubrum]|uniref:Predicted thiol-disulfide oxidoreductase YuxK, DCC family n=1 Tax=Halogranum rubrum TaxID=553466 RepID=A0A1I4BRS7_9EURY|nr:DCC1-like thiol-disulfide oxidoreductase family protein [Halogranum rubrum]SFK70571.1 Predicted thiol-disulfide oxidoreductase YuxK, DCC family [Halogranum rubrum]